jgi:hypothetical protein
MRTGYVTVERGRGTAKTESIQAQRRQPRDSNHLSRSPHMTPSHSTVDSEEEVSPRNQTSHMKAHSSYASPSSPPPHTGGLTRLHLVFE